MRLVVRLSMGLVALAAAALSYQSLAHLGTLCGYGGLAWLYPLVVDAGAAASCAAWLQTRGRQPLVMTWALLAVSVVLNGTTHYLTSTGTAPSWLLVVAVAAVPPTVLGLTVHLAVDMRRPDQNLGEGVAVGSTAPGGAGGTHTDTRPSEAQTPQGLVDPGQRMSAVPTGAAPTKVDEAGVVNGAGPGQSGSGVTELTGPMSRSAGEPAADKLVPALGGGKAADRMNPLDPVAELIEAGAGRRRLAAELGLTEHQARQLLAERRNGSEVTRVQA